MSVAWWDLFELTLERRKFLLRFTNSIRIHRPISEVFAFLADFENIPKWNYFVRKVTKTSAGPVDIGTTYHQIRKTDDQDFQITEFEQDHKIAVKTLPRSTPQFERRFILETKGSATEIMDTWELETGRNPLLERLAAGRVKAAVAENLSLFKALLEKGNTVLQDGRKMAL